MTTLAGTAMSCIPIQARDQTGREPCLFPELIRKYQPKFFDDETKNHLLLLDLGTR